MPDLVVVNTGPLIAWERMGCLDVIGRMPFDLVCPEQVRGELDEGERAGHPRIAPPWLGVGKLRAPALSLGVIDLDIGEAAVLQLPFELTAKRVATNGRGDAPRSHSILRSPVRSACSAKQSRWAWFRRWVRSSSGPPQPEFAIILELLPRCCARSENNCENCRPAEVPDEASDAVIAWTSA